MTKITVYYANDIEDAKYDECVKNTRNVEFQDSFYRVPLSKRIEWVEDSCKMALKRKTPTIFVTNDYNFMRLIQEFAGSEFSIYHVDEDKTVYDFVDLKPNYALEIGHHIFVWSARKALKQV